MATVEDFKNDSHEPWCIFMTKIFRFNQIYQLKIIINDMKKTKIMYKNRAELKIE